MALKSMSKRERTLALAVPVRFRVFPHPPRLSMIALVPQWLRRRLNTTSRGDFCNEFLGGSHFSREPSAAKLWLVRPKHLLDLGGPTPRIRS